MKILEKLKDKTVVVTGASGYIGSALVSALVEKSCSVIRISRKSLSDSSNVTSIKEDISTAIAWNEIVSRADIIFHLAGNTSLYAASDDPGKSLNSTVLPINHLIRASKGCQRKIRVVYASTATVYGMTTKRPVSEIRQPRPVTIYDLHKYFAEKQLALGSEQGLFDAVSLRLANVYGPSPESSASLDRGILNRATSLAMRGQTLTLFGDGKYVRDYVYISDVINAFLLAGVAPDLPGRVLNVGSGVGTTVLQAFQTVIAEVAKCLGHCVDIDHVEWPINSDPIERRNFTADIAKLCSLGWRPSIDLRSGIDKLIADSISLK